jgi:hypothetical protein
MPTVIYAAFTLFLRKRISMTTTNKNKGMYWIGFFVSTAALLFAIFTGWEYLTMILPFMTTFFVKAMDII